MNRTFSHYDPGRYLQFLGPFRKWLSPDYSFSPLLDLASFHYGIVDLPVFAHGVFTLWGTCLLFMLRGLL